jgi:glycyl-tRNA synthetase (class II)
MKDSIKNLWIKLSVQESKINVLLGSAILMNPKKLGKLPDHYDGFSDICR